MTLGTEAPSGTDGTTDPQLAAAQEYLKNNPLPSAATNLLESYPGLDHQTAVTLAQTAPNADAAHQQAQAIVQHVQTSGLGALEHSFYDPVLSAQPSAVMAAAQYLHSTLGPPPVSGGTITQIQNALVKDGFLASSNGVWDANSQNAYASAISAYKSQQLAGGHKPLSSMFSSVIHNLVHTATHPWDAIAGFGKDVRALAGDTAGFVAGLPDQLTFDQSGATGVRGTVSANVQRALGRSNYTDQQGIHDQNWQHAVGDLFTAAGLFTLGGVSVLKQGGKDALRAAVEDTGKTAAEKATAEATAAQTDAAMTRLQHIGVALNAAHNFGFVGRSISDIGDSLAAGTLPATDPLVQRNLGIVAKTLLLPAKVAGKVLGSNWATNLPAAARLAPVLTRIGEGAAQDGWAYSLRNFYGHSPYKLGIARAVGTAMSRTQVAAEGIHALGAIEGAAGATDAAHNIQQTTIPVLDHWADNTLWNPIPGVKLTAADMLLGFGLHGDLVGANRASRVIGDTVNGWQNAVADWAGKTGVIGAFEHTTGVPYADLLKIADGNSANLGLWMRSHQANAAEDQWVTAQLGHAPFSTGDPAEDKAIEGLRNTYNAKTDEEKQAQQALFANGDPHMQFLRNHLTGSFLRSANTKVARKAATESSLREYLQTLPLGQDLIHSGAAQFFMGPAGATLAKDDSVLQGIIGKGDVNSFSSARVKQLYAEHAPQLDPSQPGATGLMRNDGVTRDEVLGTEVPKFEAQIKAIRPDPTSIDKDAERTRTATALTDMRDYLHDHLDWDASRLQLLGDDPNKLLETIKSEADRLASNVYHTSDIPDWAIAKEKAINDAGYKIVVGTHIGHHLDGTLPDLGPIDGKLTALRRYMGKVGLDPARVQDTDVTKAQTLSIQSKVHNVLVSNPNMLTTPHADYRTVMQVLHNGVDNALPAAARGIFNAFSKVGLNKSNIQLIAERDFRGEDGNLLPNAMDAARHELEQQMAAQAGLRDIPLHRALDALTKTHEVPIGDNTFTWNGIAEADARKIMAAVDQGYRLPGYMMGWQAVENWARAGFGMGNFLMNHQSEKTWLRIPTQPLYRAVTNWPNAVLRARNNLRFTYSAIFGLRRLIKQDYKMKLEGVNPVWNALGHMQDNGDLDAAMAKWTKISGGKITDQMETDRYLIGRDIFGLYDPQWTSAYFTHELSKQGKTDSEIKDAYNRVFKYGADGGRTGLERTTNTIFFPFSFEKTLLRNTGGYLLDHPGQAMALDLAVEEWRKLDNNAEVGKWVSDHFPLLKEMQMFNAFSHGISPGQFGGVNAPILGSLLKGGSTASKDATSGHSEALLNLLMPQSWGINFTKKNLAQYMPVWGQLNKLMDAAYQQSKIGVGAAHDTLNKIQNNGWRPMTALSSSAQYQYALRRKGQLALQLEPVIKYNNAQGSDADKYLWPDTFPQGIAGLPVNKTTISAYMQYLYPAYNPQKAQDQAKQYAKQADSFVASFKTSDPAKYSQMVAFKKLADTVTLNLARDAYDTPQAAQIQNLFQQKLQSAAMQDPDWRKLWESYYAHYLGPIRSPDGRAAYGAAL
jgi:hypothetical protein